MFVGAIRETRWLRPEAQLALAEHLKHGMFYDVFSYDCIRKDKDAVLKLCMAGNYDAAFAFGGRRSCKCCGACMPA